MNENEIKNESLEEVQEVQNTSESTIEQNTNESQALIQGVMHEQNIQKISRNQMILKILSQVGLYAFLTVMAFIVIFPFLISPIFSLALNFNLLFVISASTLLNQLG